MRWMNSRLSTLLAGSSPGFTLAEMLVGMSIMAVGIGLIGGGIFQALGVERYWFDDVVATKELRHAGSWFAGDAMNAETVLIDGVPPGSRVTLTWTDSGSVPHTAIYSLSGSNLLRDLDGMQITLARRVVSADFSLSGKVLTFAMEVAADRGGTESTSLQTYLRRLP